MVYCKAQENLNILVYLFSLAAIIERQDNAHQLTTTVSSRNLYWSKRKTTHVAILVV